ncbi:unnamed protein product [Anisakis simplex]|uniref:Protein kinase domain-containing protein n=1 Tax=Anisakis simplex TaxID=6269 RepID=A0A0M3JS61_ANISI|nr:unnamed protein product [Anisakis simplex]
MYSLPSSVSTNFNVYSNPYRKSSTTSSSKRSITQSPSYSTAKRISNTNNNANLGSYINNNTNYIENPGKFSKNRRFSLKSTSSSFPLPTHSSLTTASSSLMSSNKLTASDARKLSVPATGSRAESTIRDSEKSAGKRNVSETRKFAVNSSATAASVNGSHYSPIPTKFTPVDASKDSQIDRRKQYAMNNTSSLSQSYYTDSSDKNNSSSLSAFSCVPFSSPSVAPPSASALFSREFGNSNSSSARKPSTPSSSASISDGFTRQMASRNESISCAPTTPLRYQQAQTQQQPQPSYELSNSGVLNATVFNAQPELNALNNVKTNSGNVRMNNNKNAISKRTTGLIEQQLFVKRLLQAHSVVDEMLRSRGMQAEDERLYLRRKLQQENVAADDDHEAETETTETQHNVDDDKSINDQHTNNDDDSSHSCGNFSSSRCLASSSVVQHEQQQHSSAARRRSVSGDSDSGLSLDEDDSEEWMVHTLVVEEGDGQYEREQKRRKHKTNCGIKSFTATSAGDCSRSLSYNENTKNITIEITLVNTANKGQQQQIASDFSIISKMISNGRTALNVKFENKAKLKKKKEKVVKDLSDNDKKTVVWNKNRGTLLEEKSRTDNDDNNVKIQQSKRIQATKISSKTKSLLKPKQQRKEIDSDSEFMTRQQQPIVQRTLNATLTDRRRHIVHSAAEISIQHVSFYQIASSLIKQKCINVENFVRIHFRLTQRNPKSLCASIHIPLLRSFTRIATFDAKLPTVLTTKRNNLKKFRSQTIEIAQLQRRSPQIDAILSDAHQQCAATLLRKTIPAHVRKNQAVISRVRIPEMFLKPFNLSSTISRCTLQQQATCLDDDDQKKLRTARYQLKHVDFSRTVSCNSLLNATDTTTITSSNFEENTKKCAISKKPEIEKGNEDAKSVVAEDIDEGGIRNKFSRTKAVVAERQLETIKSGSDINEDHLYESDKNDDNEPRKLKSEEMTITNTTNSTSPITKNSTKKDKLSKNTKESTKIPCSKSVVRITNDDIIANNHMNNTDDNNNNTNDNRSNETNSKMIKSYEDGDLTKGSNESDRIDERRLRRAITCINSDDLRRAFARMPKNTAADCATESANLDQTLIYEFRRRKSIPVPQAIIHAELPPNLVAFSTPRILNVKPVRDFVEPLPPAKFLRRRTPERRLVASTSVDSATYSDVSSLSRTLGRVNNNALVKLLSQKNNNLSNKKIKNLQKAIVITENLMEVPELSNNNNNSKQPSKPRLLPISNHQSSLYSQQQQNGRRQSSNAKENPFGVSLKRVSRKKQQLSMNGSSISNNTATRNSPTKAALSRKPTIPKWRQVER